MNFGQATEAMKKGHSVTRDGHVVLNLIFNHGTARLIVCAEDGETLIGKNIDNLSAQ